MAEKAGKKKKSESIDEFVSAAKTQKSMASEKGNECSNQC